MSENALSVEVFLKVPSPSYHPLLAYAKDRNRRGPDQYEWSRGALQGLVNRFPYSKEVLQEYVLALLEQGDAVDAEAALKQLQLKFGDRNEESLCRWGRLFKDEGDKFAGLPWYLKDKRNRDLNKSITFYERALKSYEAAYRIREGHYPGINVAALLLILGGMLTETGADGKGRRDESRRFATDLLGTREKWPLDYGDEDRDLWHPATAGEAYLVLEKSEDAAREYGTVLKSPKLNWHARQSMYRQVVRVCGALKSFRVDAEAPFDEPAKFFQVDQLKDDAAKTKSP